MHLKPVQLELPSPFFIAGYVKQVGTETVKFDCCLGRRKLFHFSERGVCVAHPGGGLKLPGVWFREGCMCTVHAGEGDELPSVILETGVYA